MTIDFDDVLEEKFQSDVITMPTLEFGNSTLLEPTDENLRNWDFKKKNFLREYGTYSKPRYLDKFILLRSYLLNILWEKILNTKYEILNKSQ